MTTATPAAPRSVAFPSGTSKLGIDGGTPVSASPIPFMSTALAKADIDAATAVLHSGMLRQAAKCAELEERFARLSQAKHAMTCANGTCALQLAYEPLFQPGDEILVPAWSYIATVSMIVARGCTPVFVDAIPGTAQMDPADAASKITPRVTGIAATHLYGCPVDIDAFEQLAAKHKLRVVYDAAQAHLATYKGKGIGAFGDAVTYSFYATKNLATGEGGLITCNDDAMARSIKLLRSHGETDKYLHESVGYNYRLNDIAAAIGCSRLDRLEAQTQTRQRIAVAFDAMFAQLTREVPGIEPVRVTPGATAVYHLYVVKLDASHFRVTRDAFCAALKAEGVPTAVHYPRSLPQQPALARFSRNDTPVADGLASQVFALPMHHDLSEAQINAIGEAVAKVARAYRV
ncbi:MAG: DegT/DnrJ/EryC1/StrS family aminotransferase [Planctomycetota bacterium]|nr:DegT/DnrJ/EryC1/StrS family aminotransferase [Planctomycetota bacterium]